ncbi:VpsP family polysaccharide biosynthesis protein [Vibrio neptunius]|uniref:VpsP family polysaccharide biosynthesis protein n=1 Tax=Vibrio neptunius TaxID=170651 RepID=A0ABS3AA92_9VIBR|nr:VpsP family polysaccharide biosynthesis protein [Vibrio neptunius]MBN3495293.1 VpsP family polysaccharide biosynthesis protein [Vibrio neptunius]MBN3517823.1 VpsP family polysaccharide biosynthesis protein [Vibrio neptunius]MBN3552136.1 VpsP family polysaccharide biosynthesis protein [Vibrio neptunius]MBN3580139.1 VpsP family polysaccharide biosynthesis protein [Vibrio neptunius]MCH9873805.1 VpsP family polysaccharide biosynthesis protein [Vibrio neptunius]
MRKRAAASLFKLGLAFSAICVLYLSYHFGVASLYAKAVSNQIEQWNASNKKPSFSDIESAEKLISAGLTHHPSHPHYFDLQGKVYEWKAYISDSLDKEAYLKLAKSAYLNSAELRPNWPNTWVNLATLETQMQGESRELYLRKADQKGPFVPQVNLKIATLALSHWQQFTPQERKLAMPHIYRAIKHKDVRQSFRDYLTKSSKFRFACIIMKHMPDIDYASIGSCRYLKV